MRSFGNPYQLEKDLNWKAKVTIEELIRRMIDDKLKNKNLI